MHCQKRKEYGIEFDRVLFMSDKSEEDAGKAITERMNQIDTNEYQYEAEIETANTILGVIKEHMLGEEKEGLVRDID